MPFQLLLFLQSYQSLCQLLLSSYHATVMIDHAQKMIVVIDHQHRVHLVLVHHLLHLRDFGFRLDYLRLTGHDVAHRAVEKLCLPFLHGTADVAVGNQSHNHIIHHGHT